MSDVPTADEPIELTAAGGLVGRISDGVVTIGYGVHDDWFGPGALSVGGTQIALDGGRTIEGVDDLGSWRAAMWLGDRGSTPRIDASLAAYEDEPVLVFSLRAPVGIDDALATGSFESPCVAWPALRPDDRAPDGVPEGASAFGYQYMEFALPTATDAGLAGWTRWPLRPPVVMPLMLVSSGATLMIAPLDNFHEQIVAVPADESDRASGVRCGWHGDLSAVPPGFSTEMAIVAGRDARDCLDRWAAILTARAGTVRLPRGIDALGSHVSYWTDNGAAYWYRTEPGAGSVDESGDRGDSGTASDAGGNSEGGDVTRTLVATVDDLRAREVPVRAVQLDSWFYPHRTIRPFDTEEWDVPPTGLRNWEAREDILPGGIAELRTALGDPPLVLHCRHLSSDSPYVDEHDCWIDGDYAHPKGPELYGTYLDQAVAWGAQTFEHDWLVECFLGVRGLREEPGRATAWQQGLDRQLAERGMTAQWCMATPADFMASTALGQLTSIRTSGDHGYLVPPELLWAWFLYTNALARPLGLWPYKDVFRSDGHGGSTDPLAEAALAALSGGPVGIGDALGGADADLVLRTARRDGLLVAPDAPVAAIARCFARHGVLQPEPVVGATHSLHAAGRWSYVITMNCHADSDRLATSVALDDLGDDSPAGADGLATSSAAMLDWRRGTVALVGAEGFEVELGAKGWDLRVLAPLLADGRLAVFGDTHRFAAAGRQRIAQVSDDGGGTVAVRVAGSSETVQLRGWSAVTSLRARIRTGGASGTLEDRAVDTGPDGAWTLELELPAEPGWAQVELSV